MCWEPSKTRIAALVRRSCGGDLWGDDGDILAEAPWRRVGAGAAAAGDGAMWRVAGRCDVGTWREFLLVWWR